MEKENKLPELELNKIAWILTTPTDGRLLYKYQPFYNLKKKVTDGPDLEGLRLSTEDAGISIDRPLDIDIEESYDGSSNLVINDSVNAPKIVNPRFYLIDSNNYRVGDRKGNLDTNVYTRDNFKTEANLIKSVHSIVKLDYLGLEEGGRLPVGNYTFYFKLADSDGNESDFVAESGKVVCHIGNINQPRFIRGGQLNEDSGKSVNFQLRDLDLAYNYINIYYSRTSGNSSEETVEVYKITDKFRITGIDTSVNITGYESKENLTLDDINIRYTEFKKVVSTENCQNMTFAGGIDNEYDVYETLERLSLHITPEIAIDKGVNKGIGRLDYNYKEAFNTKNGYEYYNTKNIYYKLGYWDQEIYRVGIVYIMNDYTLSPVFNIRGIKELSENQTFNLPKDLNTQPEFQEDYTISGTNENVKGVFKINAKSKVFSDGDEIRPIGLKFNFNTNVVDGDIRHYGLKHYTKGFFFVRQKRIPTILAQAVGISTTTHGNLPLIQSGSKYIMESFLTKGTKGATNKKEKTPMLGSSYIDGLDSRHVINNALLCPEASLRTEIYNSYFNSSEYVIMKSKYQTTQNDKFRKQTENHFYLGSLDTFNTTPYPIKSSLLLISPGINLIKNNKEVFSSKAGDPVIAHKNVDVLYGDYADPKNLIDTAKYNDSVSKVRGEFNTYIGSDYKRLENGVYYNIFQKGYDFEDWKKYFILRSNDSSPYIPIGDKMGYDDVTQGGDSRRSYTSIHYRGDCYINTYTHRMSWNFIDPELPTSTSIIDPYTWYKNYRVIKKHTSVIPTSYVDDQIDKDGSNEDEKFLTELVYNKLLPQFTFKSVHIPDFKDQNDTEEKYRRIRTPEDKSFKKYSERNGTFGYDKINRPDVNAVGLGHWVTYKTCSNINLAMRDIEHDNPSEEALHGMKRSFYPLQSIDGRLKLPESKAINRGISKTTGDRYYFEIPDVPFLKTSFPNRIYYSNPLRHSTFVNGNRVFLSKNYQDYSSEYGALVKLVEWYGTLMAIMEHGVLQIPVNERAMMKNESGENVYINTDTVLPKNPKVLSNTFGSIWPDSVIKTSRFVYGIDTVGKKIWRSNGESFEIISDLKMQQFLNDNIKLRESDQKRTIGTHVIKTHYNAFKHDVMFTYYYEGVKWHLCWNELLEKWVTRYSWFPEFSENINNIFYTFANRDMYGRGFGSQLGILYKHGFAGTMSEEGDIKPTKWYERQEPFEFEYIVAPQPGVQKIYNNFDIVSNNVEPNSFIYELIGDGFMWNDQKEEIYAINEDATNHVKESDTTNFTYTFDLNF